MKITPIAAPGAQPTQAPQAQQQSARDRAIAMLTSQAPAELDQNNISPENMSLAKPQEEVQEPVNQPTEDRSEAKDDSDSTNEDKLNKQYQLLAKKEKMLRAKEVKLEQQLQAKQQEVDSKLQQLQQKEQEYKSGYISKQRLQQDAVGVLAELGITYDQITEQILNSSQRNPYVDATINELKQELQALKAEKEQERSQMSEYEKQQYQQALNQIKADTTKLVSSDPAFETVKEANAIQDVVDLIEQTYKDEGILLSIEEAAQQVEDYLVEEALRFAKINKIKNKLNPESVSKVAEPQNTIKQNQPMKTLTNQNSVSRPMSARERAMLAFKGELNKS